MVLAAVTRAQQQIGQGPLYDALGAIGQALGAGAAARGVVYELVYQPGNPGPLAPNAYTSLAALALASQTVAGQKLVTFDPSFLAPGTPMPIAAGVYDFRSAFGAGGGGGDTVWRCDPARYPAPSLITLADGVTLAGVSTFRDVRVVSNNTTTPVITAGAEDTGWFLEGWAAVQSNGTQPFISDAVALHNVLVEVSNDAEIQTGTAPFLRMLTAGQALTVLTADEGLVNQDVLAAVAGVACGARVGSAGGFIDRAQVGLPGGVLAIAFGEQDQFIQHATTPPNPAVWVGGSPGTVYAAIERLAAALVARTGGVPIP